MVVVVLVLRVVVIVITCADIFLSQESKLVDYTQFLFVLVFCGHGGSPGLEPSVSKLRSARPKEDRIICSRI